MQRRRFLRCRVGLLGVWLAGSAAGVRCFLLADTSYVSWMRGVCECPVSIVWLRGLAVLPFLLLLLTVGLGAPRLLYALGFFKAFAFTFAAGLCLLAGREGLRLLLFSAGEIPVELAAWLRALDRVSG